MSFSVPHLGVLTWGLRRRVGRRLYAFALAEHGSLLDLRLAARLTVSAERAGLYLQHAADEERHARMFSRHATVWLARVGEEAPPPPRADCEALFERLGEVGFLAFVHRGERRGCRHFEVYRDWFSARGEDKTAALFAAVLEDEKQHAAYSMELLEELAGSPASARRALRRAAFWEGWRTYRRVGRALAGATYALTMYALYLTTAPLALLLRVVRPRRGGWRLPEDGT